MYENLAFDITHWDHSKTARNSRKLLGITDETMRNQIISFLNEKLPNSQNKEIKIFFTDIAEMEEDNTDITSENLKKIAILA